MLFEGITERKGENFIRVIDEVICHEMGIRCASAQINLAHRLGPYIKGKTCQI